MAMNWEEIHVFEQIDWVNNYNSLLCFFFVPK